MTTVIEVDGRIRLDASDVEKGAKKAEKSLLGLGKVSNPNLKALGLTVGGVGIALGTMAKAAEMAYSAIKEGAALELARSRFDNLSVSIGTTADSLLGKLRDATGGLISDAQLVASATDMMNLGFAKTEDQAVRLTSVAGQLGWNMQQLTLTLANQSTMRLDALGLSVEEVTGRFKELKAQGVAVQDAFQMAVIEAGEKKLKLLGSAAETSAGQLMKFEAGWENTTNALKIAAVQLADNIGLIETLVNVSSGLARGAGFVDELTAAYRRGAIAKEEYDRLMTASRGDVVDRDGNLIEAGAMRQLDLLIKLKEALDAGTISQGGYNRMVADVATKYQDVANELSRYNAQMAQGAGGLSDIAEETQRATQSTTRWRDILSLTDSQMEAGREWRNAYDEDLQRIAAAEEAVALKAQHAAEALAVLSAAFNGVSADYMTELPTGDQPLITPTAQVSVTTGGLSSEQADLLQQYSDLAAKASEEIYNLTNGIGTFGMEQEKVNEKLAEAQDELAYYQEKMAPLAGVTGETSSSQRDLAVNTEAVYTELYKQAEAAGAAPETLVALAIATGQMSEAQGEAALKAAALFVKIEELGRLIAAGLPLDVAMQQLQDWITVINGGFIPASQEAETKATAVRTAMIEAAEGSLEPATALGTNVAEGLTTGITDATETAEEAATALGDAVIDAAKIALGIESPSTVFSEIGENVIAGLIEGVSATPEAVGEALVAVVTAAVEAVNDMLGGTPSETFADIGRGVIDGFVGGIRELGDDVSGTLEDVANQGVEATKSALGGVPSGQFNTIGRGIIDGLIAGIRSNAAGVENALRDIIDAAIARIKADLEIHSPSQVFAEIGENIGLGLVEGIDRSEDEVIKALESLMSKVTGIARGFAKAYEDAVLDPIDEAIDANEVAAEETADMLAAAVADLSPYAWQGALDNIMSDNFTAAQRAAALHGMRFETAFQRSPEAMRRLQEAIRLADEQVRLEQEKARYAEEYAAQQERILELQEKQAQLDFLKTQLDLVQLIGENGLDASILDGLALGLDADKGGVLDAMIAAMGQLVTAAENELDIHSPSAVFEDIGLNIMAGLAKGLSGRTEMVDNLKEELQRALAAVSLGGLSDAIRDQLSIGDWARQELANRQTIYNQQRSMQMFGNVYVERDTAFGNYIKDIYGVQH